MSFTFELKRGFYIETTRQRLYGRTLKTVVSHGETRGRTRVW